MLSRPSPFSLLLLALPLSATAQHFPCGTDAVHEHRITPALNDADQRIQHQLAARARNGHSRGQVLTVPVVFHVIHDNGPENIPDTIIQLALEQMNLRLRNEAPFSDTTGHPVDIQLCLASVDPFGNATSGITRRQNALAVHTWNQELAVKALDRWDPYLYANVWLVRTITDAGVDGYSSFPSNAGDAYDGVVMEAQYLLDNYLLTHEFGHYFGLFHTFQWGCPNDDCTMNGDGVCDTPPDYYSPSFYCMDNSCTTDLDDTTGLSPFSADVAALPNYMDYTSCPLSFSQGQADRMYDALGLARAQLLTSNGCGANPGQPAPVAACTVDSSQCTGRVVFTCTTPDASFVQWDLGNDGWDAVGTTYTVDLPATGNYAINMLVTTVGGADTLLMTFHARVGPTPHFPIAGGFQDLPIDAWSGRPTACLGDTLTFSAAPGMASYLWSTGNTTPTIDRPVDAPFGLQLAAVDSTGLSWSNCAFANVNVNLPPVLSADVGDSVVCGTLFNLYMADPGFPCAKVWYHNGQVLTGPTFDYSSTAWELGWHDHAVRLVDNVGCNSWTNTVSFFTMPTPAPVISQQGGDLVLDHGCNNLGWMLNGAFLDFNQNQLVLTDAAPGCYNVRCFDCSVVTSDTFCLTVTGEHALTDADAPLLFPSPVTDVLRLSLPSTTEARSVVLDATGRIVLSPSVREVLHGIDVRALAPGTYVLLVEAPGQRSAFRFIRE